MDPDIGKILGLASAMRKAQCMCVGVKLGVFDVFKEDKVLYSADITSALGIDPEFGFRWLRSLAALGFLKHHDPRKFSLTPSGKKLRKDAKIPLWRMVSHLSDDDTLACYNQENFINMLKSGMAPSFDLVFNKTIWDRFEEDKDCGDNFDEAMKVNSLLGEKNLRFFLDFVKHHFSGSINVCDIGGGNGTLMKLILDHFQANKSLNGTVMDLERVFKSKDQLQKHDRLEYVPGNFFDASKIPHDKDIYTLKSILHDWNDEKSIEILKNIHEVAKVGSRVMIFEIIVSDTVNEKNGGNCFMDIHMMTVTGGKERKISEWIDLLEKSGWKFERVIEIINPMIHGLVIGVKEK